MVGVVRKKIYISKDVLKTYGEDAKKIAIEEVKRDLIELLNNTPAEKMVTVDERANCWEIEVDCKIM